MADMMCLTSLPPPLHPQKDSVSAETDFIVRCHQHRVMRTLLILLPLL